MGVDNISVHLNNFAEVFECLRFGLSTFWFVDVSVCPRFVLSTFWSVHVLVCRRFGLSTFRFVDVLVCRLFGLSTFRFVDVLVVAFRFVDVLTSNLTENHYWAIKTTQHIVILNSCPIINPSPILELPVSMPSCYHPSLPCHWEPLLSHQDNTTHSDP